MISEVLKYSQGERGGGGGEGRHLLTDLPLASSLCYTATASHYSQS